MKKEVIVLFLFFLVVISACGNIQYSPEDKDKEQQDKGTCITEPQQKFPFKPDKQKNAVDIQSLDNLDKEILKTNDKKTLQGLLQERKKVLIEVMRNQPEAALSSSFLLAQRQSTRGITQNCFEYVNTVEGLLEVYHADFFDEKFSLDQYILVTDDKRRIVLHPAFGLNFNPISRTKIKVKGFLLDNEMVFDGTKPVNLEKQDFGGVDVLAGVPEDPIIVNQETHTPTNTQQIQKSPASDDYGFIYVSTGATNPAELYLDNNFSGFSPITLTTTTGDHKITVAKWGYNVFEQDVPVLTAQTSTLNLKLTPGGQQRDPNLPPPVLGEQKTLVVTANFLDTSADLSQNNVTDLVFNKSNNYYRENSYNKINLVGNVFGPISLQISQTCDPLLVLDKVLDITDSFVNFSNYSRLIIISPMGNCWFGGIATLGKIPLSTQDGIVNISISWINSVYYNFGSSDYEDVINHELGHQFGNGHASFLDCGNISIGNFNVDNTLIPSDCYSFEYGDPFDTMGAYPPLKHYNAAHKENVGWFNSLNIQQIGGAPGYSYIWALEPIEMPTKSLKALKIQRGENDYLYLEYRQPIGFDGLDQFLPLINSESNVFNGTLIHMRKTITNCGGSCNSVYHSQLIYPRIFEYIGEYSWYHKALASGLTPGESFIDPYSGTQVTTISKNSSVLVLNVTLGLKTDFINPNVSILYPPDHQQSVVYGNITIIASATDESGISKVVFFYYYYTPLADGYYRVSAVKFAEFTNPPYEAILDTKKINYGYNQLVAVAHDKSGDSFGLYNNGAVSFADIYINPDLYITTTPTPADIYLDGNFIGLSPIIINNVSLTKHSLRAFITGYYTNQTNITFSGLGGTNPVNLSLSLTPIEKGSIYVTTNPTSAYIYLDNILIGLSPITIQNLTLGIHTIKASKVGYYPLIKNINVTCCQTTNVSLILRRINLGGGSGGGSPFVAKIPSSTQ